MDPVTDPESDRPSSPAPEPEPAPPAAANDSAAAPATPAAGLSFGRAVRRRTLRRFAMAFVFGVLGVLAVTAGALAAYETSNDGRILPGVHVGGVDLSGLGPSEARARLLDQLGSISEGELTITAADVTGTYTYSQLGRRLDLDAIVDQAMAVGRHGATIERIASHVRTLVRGIDIEPVVTSDEAHLAALLRGLAAQVDVAPTDASVALTGEDFQVSPSADGRSADQATALAAASAMLTDPRAGATLKVTVPMKIVGPRVTNDMATAAREAALRIATDVKLVDGADAWTIPGASIRGWITFVATDAGYAPIVADEALQAGLAEIADDVAKAPVDATFLIGDGSEVVGVTQAKNGRALDVPATLHTLREVVAQRANGLTVAQVPVATSIVEPELTTAEATQTAPLMQPISQWTTYFPVGIKNGYGANIWIPARDIDGMVVMPGEWFDFWKAIGPVTREHGYKDGGAIINGKTEPQGALAGGICSCSTTLFNAALRAGLEMGARRNHYYYIDRYPIGLDATVFQSSSGSVQTMSWRNDTDAPILIRGYGWKEGSKGYVKFVLWSIPNGREVSLSKAIVKNVKPASDSVVYTTALKPGVRERVEYPVDGKDVWVTRTVKDASGHIIHQETYYSHYARITGILRIGKAPDPGPSPTPTP